MKYFNELIETNNFLRKFIKLRNQNINGIKLTSDSIISWKLKEN